MEFVALNVSAKTRHKTLGTNSTFTRPQETSLLIVQLSSDIK